MPETSTLPDAAVKPALPSADTKPVTQPSTRSVLPEPASAPIVGNEATTLPADAQLDTDTLVDTDSAVEAEQRTDRAVQKDEIDLVYQNTLSRKKNALQEAIRKEGAGALNSEAAKALRMLDLIDQGVLPPAMANEQLTGNPLKVILNGKDIAIIGNNNLGVGENVTITSINAVDEDFFECTALREDNSGSSRILISKDALSLAHLITDKDVITAGMSPSEKKLVDLYIATETAKEGDDPLADNDMVNTTIKEAAKDARMFTIDHAKAFTENIGGLTEAQKAEILDATNGNLMSFETFDKALRKTHLSPDKLSGKVAQLEGEIEELTIKFPKGQRPPEIDSILKNKQQELHEFTEVQKLYESGFKEFFMQVQTGEAEPDTAKAMIDVFSGGQITKDAIEKAFPQVMRQEGETDHEWRERMKKRLGIAGLLMLMVVVAAAQATPALGPEQRPQH